MLWINKRCGRQTSVESFIRETGVFFSARRQIEFALAHTQEAMQKISKCAPNLQAYPICSVCQCYHGYHSHAALPALRPWISFVGRSAFGSGQESVCPISCIPVGESGQRHGGWLSRAASPGSADFRTLVIGNFADPQDFRQ